VRLGLLWGLVGGAAALEEAPRRGIGFLGAAPFAGRAGLVLLGVGGGVGEALRGVATRS
jgi:hypothetical protein